MRAGYGVGATERRGSGDWLDKLAIARPRGKRWIVHSRYFPSFKSHPRVCAYAPTGCVAVASVSSRMRPVPLDPDHFVPRAGWRVSLNNSGALHYLREPKLVLSRCRDAFKRIDA